LSARLSLEVPTAPVTPSDDWLVDVARHSPTGALQGPAATDSEIGRKGDVDFDERRSTY
jgi:hypothetical protein